MDRSHDKQFNYQLTIQKLEEELSLYRNGTTGQELLECIREKDIELEKMRSIINEKNDNLRKIAKSSSSVLETCNTLQTENFNLTQERDELLATRSQLNNQIESLTQDANTKSSTIEKMTLKLKSSTDEISALNTELTDLHESVSKLQERCAILVREKTDKSKLLDKEKSDRRTEVRELRVS
jgi:chromosome segregation ATPase